MVLVVVLLVIRDGVIVNHATLSTLCRLHFLTYILQKQTYGVKIEREDVT